MCLSQLLMRVDPRWDKPWFAFDLGLSTLKFTDSTKYLGAYLKCGSKFVCSYEHLKLHFYSSFKVVAVQCTAEASPPTLNVSVLN